MFGLGPATRIYVALGATDMRKGFDGLYGIVRDRLGLEVRSAGICYNGPSTAPNSSDKHRRVRITHPFHPLCGKQFDLVEHKCIFGESYLSFYDPQVSESRHPCFDNVLCCNAAATVICASRDQ